MPKYCSSLLATVIGDVVNVAHLIGFIARFFRLMDHRGYGHARAACHRVYHVMQQLPEITWRSSDRFSQVNSFMTFLGRDRH